MVRLTSIHFVRFWIFTLISVRFINLQITTSISIHITRNWKFCAHAFYGNSILSHKKLPYKKTLISFLDKTLLNLTTQECILGYRIYHRENGIYMSRYMRLILISLISSLFRKKDWKFFFLPIMERELIKLAQMLSSNSLTEYI